MKMEQTEHSETSAYKLQTPRNYPKEIIQHTEHDESLKLRKPILLMYMIIISFIIYSCIQFVPHRDHNVAQLERPTSEGCI